MKVASVLPFQTCSSSWQELSGVMVILKITLILINHYFTRYLKHSWGSYFVQNSTRGGCTCGKYSQLPTPVGSCEYLPTAWCWWSSWMRNHALSSHVFMRGSRLRDGLRGEPNAWCWWSSWMRNPAQSSRVFSLEALDWEMGWEGSQMLDVGGLPEWGIRLRALVFFHERL